MTVHPETGLRYIHVIPKADGLREIWDRFHDRHPWMTAITLNEFSHARDAAKPSDFFIAWHQEDPGPRDQRCCKVTTVYSEAIGRRHKMLPEHSAVLDRFCLGGALHFDAVFVHTPWMADHLRTEIGIRTYLFPVGWDEASQGVPHFEQPRSKDLVFFGAEAGKRSWAIPALQRLLGKTFYNANYTWGKELLKILDASRAALYIPHSDVITFSAWRMWQAAATSAALIAEVADCWPAIPWTHFVPLTCIDRQNVKEVAMELVWILSEVDLVSIAKRAHEELAREYTTQKCIERFLLPASVKIAQR